MPPRTASGTRAEAVTLTSADAPLGGAELVLPPSPPPHPATQTAISRTPRPRCALIVFLRSLQAQSILRARGLGEAAHPSCVAALRQAGLGAPSWPDLLEFQSLVKAARSSYPAR